MSDERVDRLLGDLPRETARPDFTARLLTRLDEPAPDRAAAWLGRLAVPVAAAVVLIAGLVAREGLTPERPAGTAEVRRLLEEIRREHGRLEGELAALRELREAPVYVGGDEEVDLVLDLDPVQERDVRPAASARP